MTSSRSPLRLAQAGRSDSVLARQRGKRVWCSSNEADADEGDAALLVVDSWTRRAYQVKQFNEQSKGVAHPWVISYRG